jgi:tRNA threonylcarbamoyl adenosine modification protein YeaZ
MHVLLALESSLRTPSCALQLDGGHLIAREGGRAVEGFSGLIRSVLREAGLAVSDVNEIAVAAGPGSYMGVRAAVATANALGMARGLPVTSVVSTDAAAVAVEGADRFSVVLPAGRSRSFVAQYAREGARLERDGTPLLIDGTARSDEAGFVTAVPGGLADKRSNVILSAGGVARVFREQRHLLVEFRAAQAATILPPPTIGGRS